MPDIALSRVLIGVSALPKPSEEINCILSVGDEGLGVFRN